MPDREKRCVALLRKAGCTNGVIDHCRAVHRTACEYAREIDIADPALVEAGALLHDVGRSATHSIHHAQDGAAWLRREGIPEPVVRIVECHIGAGLTADECSLVGLLPIDSITSTVEEKIVANADNLTGGSGQSSIWEELARAYSLPPRIRRRFLRLWLELEQMRRA
jgi:uncharacterized protein